ncbi:hypothetical protein F5Y16DRAFT_424697 [Xylariaceae sp. FL0255]|nr:hypothetical protein F5Y16DRAFT_424697 [Xylariaceae sp. FL0255]
MQFFVFISLLTWLARGTNMDGLPRGILIRRQLPDNYTESTIEWNLPVTEGGSNYTFYGTVQEVFAKINEIRVQQGLEPHPDPLSTSTEVTYLTDSSSLSRRVYTNTICNVGLSAAAPTERIEEGIIYLENIKGTCTNGPGPGNCGRISCSYNSAIYWCNDNPYPFTQDCSRFAAYAAEAEGTCSYNTSKGAYVRGQAFDSASFNVMVGYDKC